MLSILIPVFNYNIKPLVEELHEQATKLGIDFEILCIDDASTNTMLIEINKKIDTLSFTRYELLENNIGRSKIRNLLAKKAKFEWLLFLDADVLPKSNDFLKLYFQSISEKINIIYGGILYQETPPKNDSILRWKYGNKREALPCQERSKKPYIRFLTLNFLINKNVFNLISFNENIPNNRHEDTLFALNAKKEQITIKHINNPSYHLGIETSKQFLIKSLESIDNLHLFINQKLINPNDVFISKVAITLEKIKLNHIVLSIFKTVKVKMEKQLLSKNPSLLLFDFYRLGYYYLKKQITPIKNSPN